MSGWGQAVEVPLEERVCWNAGTRTLWARRTSGQWLLGSVEVGDEMRQDLSWDVGPWSDAGDGPATARVAVAEGARARLVPRPPPRALVARPELPLAVPSHESATVYVGIPLWAEIQIEGRAVADRALVRLSDTWFGSPQEGELCFATRTHLTMDRNAAGRRAYRAVCTVHVVNRSDEPLPLERLRIPGPALDLWVDAHGGLCTSSVRVVREAGRDLDETIVESKAPESASGGTKVGQAREPQTTPRLAKALSAVWKGMGGAI